jgi:hypothetical protein
MFLLCRLGKNHVTEILNTHLFLGPLAYLQPETSLSDHKKEYFESRDQKGTKVSILTQNLASPSLPVH